MIDLIEGSIIRYNASANFRLNTYERLIPMCPVINSSDTGNIIGTSLLRDVPSDK